MNLLASHSKIHKKRVGRFGPWNFFSYTDWHTNQSSMRWHACVVHEVYKKLVKGRCSGIERVSSSGVLLWSDRVKQWQPDRIRRVGEAIVQVGGVAVALNPDCMLPVLSSSNSEIQSGWRRLPSSPPCGPGPMHGWQCHSFCHTSSLLLLCSVSLFCRHLLVSPM